MTKRTPVIELDKHGIYPYEICLDVNPVERGWFPYMISDVCCLHSMMFSVRAFTEGTVHNQLSRLACLHYAKTLQLLQARLNELDQNFATSDSTIMVVFLLASAAEIMEDFAVVATHIEGLEKIVSLRGGVRALNTHNNIQVKVCRLVSAFCSYLLVSSCTLLLVKYDAHTIARADLSYALLSGQRPRLLKEGIPWECFIAGRGLIQCSHQPHDAHIRDFLEATSDQRLHNALRDLHAFSCISNLAYQTTRKLSPEIYNEIMISILYRLTRLSFENDPMQEAIRIGLLAVSSTIFMQRQYMEHPYDHLSNLYRTAMYKLHETTDITLPVPVELWLIILLRVVMPKESSTSDWLSVWLDHTVLRAEIDSWSQAREILRSIVWVDFIHDRLGKPTFEDTMRRLGRAAE